MESTMINSVIIVAGGTGSRMHGEIPKQFMLLNGKPLIQYSLEAFYIYDPSLKIILVIHPDYLTFWEKQCSEFKVSIPFEVVAGGKTRFDSVKNGLALIGNEGFVAVHDAARPVINAEFVRKIFSEAEKYGSAMPGVAVHDTIRSIEGDTSQQLDRSLLRAMQTPQVYKVSELKSAYSQSYKPLFNDEASVMQSAGFRLHLTDGRVGNIKITSPEDIALAEVLMKNLTRAGLRT
jgi:2-C-methyl-D-erythritol 4-phosphate cytidylyltransferase